MKTPVKTIVFDLDGTLVDSLPDIIASFLYVLEAEGFPRPEVAAVRALVGRPLDEMFASFAEAPYLPALVARYREHYSRHFVDTSRLYPGVAELLGELRRRGYLLVVATTKRSKMARSFVSALRLMPLLDHVQGTDDFPHKPAPDVIHHALAAVNGEGTWMVGDTSGDILAGRAAGLATYAVTWGTEDAATLRGVKPDALEPTLEDLLRLAV